MTRARDLAAFVSNADGDIKFDTDTLFIDSSANRVGILETEPDRVLHINGGTTNTVMKLESTDAEVYMEFRDSGGVSSYLGYNGTELRILPNNDEVATFNTTGIVFNEDSDDKDFRVESDNVTHMLYVDAAQDTVGIRSSATDAVLNIGSKDGSTDAIRVTGGGGNNFIAGYGNQGNIAFSVNEIGADDPGVLKLYRNGSASHVIDADDGNAVIFNEQGEDIDFRVESGSYSHMLFVDADRQMVSVGQAVPSGYDGDLVVNGSSSSTATAPMRINRSTDGYLIRFMQGNNTEGYISVSGTTVSYNGFAGRHESSGIPTTTPRGTVVSTIDELDVYLAGVRQGETRTDHAKVEVSNTVGDPCVYGVVDDYTETGAVNVVSVGIGVVLVTGSCAKGDLLESNGDGTAKVQSDDIIRSKTIGKVTIGNSDTGVKLVPCVMYCG